MLKKINVRSLLALGATLLGLLVSFYTVVLSKKN